MSIFLLDVKTHCFPNIRSIITCHESTKAGRKQDHHILYKKKVQYGKVQQKQSYLSSSLDVHDFYYLVEAMPFTVCLNLLRLKNRDNPALVKWIKSCLKQMC